MIYQWLNTKFDYMDNNPDEWINITQLMLNYEVN